MRKRGCGQNVAACRHSGGKKGEVCQEVQQKRRGSHRSRESHRDFSEVGNPAKTRTDSTQNSNFNVCNAEGSEKKHLATAGARYVIVGTVPDRKSVA
jgi:hypothetical protein